MAYVTDLICSACQAVTTHVNGECSICLVEAIAKRGNKPLPLLGSYLDAAPQGGVELDRVIGEVRNHAVKDGELRGDLVMVDNFNFLADEIGKGSMCFSICGSGRVREGKVSDLTVDGLMLVPKRWK